MSLMKISTLVFCLMPAALPLADDSVVSIRVRFGLSDAQPSSWDGSLSVSGGQLVSLRLWRPHPSDKLEGASWKLSSRQGVNFQKRPWEPEPLVGKQPYIIPTGVIVDVKGSTATRVRFETQRGNFEVRPFALPPDSPQRLLGGNALADRVPTVHAVSAPGPQNDYATLAAGTGGDTWAAWIAFAGGKNRVVARRHTGKDWEEARAVSEDHSDIYLVKAGRDGKGGVWFVWSAQVDGNWDLHGRRFDGAAWSPVERLTSAPGPDIEHAMTTDSRGRVWLVWQSFRAGRSDIFGRYHDGASWSPEQKISESPANDWQPSIAADSKGRLHVAWDTYDQGNYDVVMRTWTGTEWTPINAIASTPKFEAHVSLTCDRQNRLWAAWNEAGTQWGKDTGFLLNRQGSRLYQDRWLAVAVLEGTTWQEPVVDIEKSLPPDLRGYNDLPLVKSDANGRVWLLFRHRLPRVQDTPSDAPMHRAAWELYATSYAGDRWTEPVFVPFSQGRTDMRAALEADGAGNLFAAWPTDNRDYEEFLFKQADVNAARIAAPAGAAHQPRLTRRIPAEIASFPLHPNEPQDLARIRGYQIRSGGKTYRVYRGDTHRHTEISMDGYNDGSLLDAYRYSLDAAQLDYVMVSEHNGNAGPDLEYVNWMLQQMADVLMIRERFLPMYGYERSVNYPNGHRNVIFARRGNPTLPIPADEAKGETGAAALYEHLKKNNGIAISHTSATGMGTDWRDNDPDVEPLVEIYQGDRVSAEYEGAPKAASGGKLTTAPGGYRPAGYVWNAWAKGYKLGVQASSDHLSTHISYACTIAESFTREGLLDAMKKRHSYGATDNIILDYRLRTTGGEEYLQGDKLTTGRGFTLSVKIIGTAPVRQVDIIKNNTFIHTVQPMKEDVEFTFSDAAAGDRPESYYYVRVLQADDQAAWSSPIWVTVK